MVTETVTVRMSRGDSQTAWGFRLHGGSEFQKPLTIEKVVLGSLSDRAGLRVGDHVTTVAGRPADGLAHTDAQTVIRGCGNNLDLIVTRQAPHREWQPSIMPSDTGANYSLKSQTTTSSGHIGSGHNTAAKPFSSGSTHSTSHHSSQHSYDHSSGGVQHLQYNSPSAIYSQESKAEAYRQQTGQGAGGGDGSEKPYLHSAALEAVREEESHGIRPTYTGDYHDALHHSRGSEQSGSFQRLTHSLHAEGHHESHPGHGGQEGEGGPPACANCGKPVTGMYAKASGMVFHADCYNCATCGNSLKNVGYHLINNKLYCDIHARQVQNVKYGGEPVAPAAFFPPAAPLTAPPVHSPGSGHERYQPEVMTKGPARPSVRSTMDPHVRGVPTRHADQSVHTISNVTHTSSTNDYSGGIRHVAPAPAAPMPAPAPTRPKDIGRTQASSFHSESTKTTTTGASGQEFSTPRRGRGVLKQLGEHPRIPVCEKCSKEIRGPFVLALNSTWCPDHFVCNNGGCGRKLLDIGFVEENGGIYCEFCFEQHFAPRCGRCSKAIVGDSLRALNQNFHPQCFTCTYCHKAFGREAFFLEDSKPYCEADWNKLFTTKCVSCQFPIEAGDRWVEALGNAYHSDCFTCTVCQKNLEGLTFFSKGGKPYCKQHA